MPYKMPDRKLLVTGATGYIGYRLLAHVREYLSAEFVPTALVRPTSCTIDLKRLLDYPQSLSDSSVRVADILDVSSLHDAVRGITHVVHLAADMDFFPEDPGRLTRTNVEGTRNLLQACATEASRSKMPLRFVYISSTEAIGPVDDLGRPGSEMDPCQPDCQYGISKAMAEDVVREFSSQLQCCILRVTGVYGPGERFFFHEFAAMTESGLLLVTPGPLDGCLMMSHIEDVISAIKLALLRDEATNQCYIVAPDDCYSYKELARILAESFRRSPPMITVPLSVVKVIVRVLMPLLNYGKKRIFMIHPTTFDKTRRRREYSNAKIKRELGYQPRSTEEGIRETIRMELNTGGMKRHVIAPVISASITLCSVVFFGFSRIFWLRHE